jgi:hypothetical protein
MMDMANITLNRSHSLSGALPIFVIGIVVSVGVPAVHRRIISPPAQERPMRQRG